MRYMMEATDHRKRASITFHHGEIADHVHPMTSSGQGHTDSVFLSNETDFARIIGTCEGQENLQIRRGIHR